MFEAARKKLEEQQKPKPKPVPQVNPYEYLERRSAELDAIRQSVALSARDPTQKLVGGGKAVAEAAQAAAAATAATAATSEEATHAKTFIHRMFSA